MLTTVKVKENPEIKRIILAAFPNYKKHNAFVSVFNGGANISSYWSGGSRDEHAIVEIATGRRKNLPTQTHPYFDIASRGLANTQDEFVSVDNAGNVTLKILPPGYALVTAGTFCGKAATASIKFNSEDMPKLLTA